MPVLFCVLGSLFYFHTPIAPMTNPPMNWGYPRTVEGFIHAFTRGQYDRIHPTSDPLAFFRQLIFYCVGLAEEFNLVCLLIALVPFFYFAKMQRRERGWMIGLFAI